MSWIIKLIALLAQLQNNQLVLDIEQCILTNSTPAAIWACVLKKLAGANLTPGTPDHAVAEAAKTLASAAKLP